MSVVGIVGMEGELGIVDEIDDYSELNSRLYAFACGCTASWCIRCKDADAILAWWRK